MIHIKVIYFWFINLLVVYHAFFCELKKAKTFFIDPVELLIENSKNPTCRKFKDDGYCPYGLSCKYSHVPKGIDFTFVDPHCK